MTTEVLAETRALCPTCLDVLPAQTVEREGKVCLQRTCEVHGSAETLVLSDAEWWKWSRSFVKPGRAPEQHRVEGAHLRHVALAQDNDRAGRVEAAAPGAPGHLHVLAGQQVAEAGAVVLARRVRYRGGAGRTQSRPAAAAC